jgi:2-methylcitrate dehydratase PrpD
MDGLTAELCRFVATTRADDIPAEVVAVGKNHILDSLACALAGSVAPASGIIRDFLGAGGGAPGAAAVLGTNTRLAPRFAAFANGAAIHADNFDDTAPQPSPDRNGGIHATGTVLAAALALAEAQGRSGTDLMLALQLGCEVSCKLNHAADAEHHNRGYHPTSTLNIFGVAAAAGRLLGLSEEALARAIGIAASQSAGLRINFGSMTDPFHSGHVAEAGIVSAELAARGFTAAKNALEAPQGFFFAYAGGFDAGAIGGKLGKPWAFVDPGTWIKPYPCGSLTHPAITALIELSKREAIKPEAVSTIRIRTNRRVANTLIHNQPKDALESKFSMPFAAAMALERRQASLAEFTDEFVQSAPVQALMQKVDYGAYEKAGASYTNVTTLIELALADGRKFSLRADFAKGTPQNPMSFGELADKFRGCAAYARWPADKTETAIDRIADLEAVADIRAITKLLSVEV